MRGTPEAIARTQRSSARYYQRPDATSFQSDPTRTSLTGYAYQLALGKNSGRHWQGGLVYQVVSPGFESNDLGFQSDASQRGISTGAAVPGEPARPALPELRHLSRSPTTSGTSTAIWSTAPTALILSAQLSNFWDFQVRGDYTPPAYDDRLTRGGPLARQPTFGDVRLTLNSDTRKTTRLSANLTQSWTAADEHQTEADLTLSVRPTPALRLSLGPALTCRTTRSPST